MDQITYIVAANVVVLLLIFFYARSRRPAVAAKPAAPTGPPPKPAPIRSEALTLLAALQRDARFVDFIKEPIDAYDDAQIGAAVRSVHKECGTVLARFFDLAPLKTEPEGAAIEVRSGFDPAEVKLVGNVTGSAPFRGTLTHPGWRATKCAVPEWQGSESAALVVAPAEIEVK